jgi:hypothetical protein
MTMKTTVCATAVALLAGTACFAVQAEARDPATPANQFKVSTSHGSKKLYMSAAAIYDAGVRRGDAQASRSAYLRGFRDGTSTAAYAPRQYAYAPRQYVVNSAPVYAAAPLYDAAPGYSAAPAYGYPSYGTPAVAGYSYNGGVVPSGDSYGTGIAGYSYNGGVVSLGDSYGNSYGYGQYNGGEYNAGYAPLGLMAVRRW